MYEELAFDLRKGYTDRLKEAADAIEERDKAALTIQHEMMAEAESHLAQVERLNKQIDELQKQVAYWQAQLTKSMCGETLAELEKPRWVSVTERLPEENCQALAYYGFDRGDGYLGMMFVQVLDYYAHGPAPHFQHEGLNGMKVTHWMPLPEPPKEEYNDRT